MGGVGANKNACLAGRAREQPGPRVRHPLGARRRVGKGGLDGGKGGRGGRGGKNRGARTFPPRSRGGATPFTEGTLLLEGGEGPPELISIGHIVAIPGGTLGGRGGVGGGLTSGGVRPEKWPPAGWAGVGCGGNRTGFQVPGGGDAGEPGGWTSLRKESCFGENRRGSECWSGAKEGGTG